MGDGELREWVKKNGNAASLAFSVAAILVSFFACDYARRSANAAEEQVRPRLVIEEPVFLYSESGEITVAITLKNYGVSSAVLSSAAISISGHPGIEEGEIDGGAESRIVDPGKSTVVEVSVMPESGKRLFPTSPVPGVSIDLKYFKRGSLFGSIREDAVYAAPNWRKI